MARIVLVHGAFAGAWCWEPVLGPLSDAGHSVQAVDLPGSGEDTTPAEQVTLEACGERVRRVLAEGEPAVLVGQSMGGMVITQAAALCPEHVSSLVYVAAFAPRDGQSLMDLVSYPEAADDQVQANMVLTENPPVAVLPREAARQAMLNCCSDEQFAWAGPRLGPQPVGAFRMPLEIPEGNRSAFERLPRAYLLCTEDHSIPPVMQRRMLQDTRCDPVIELDTDHWPWLSRTEEFLAALEQIMEAHAAALR